MAAEESRATGDKGGLHREQLKLCYLKMLNVLVLLMIRIFVETILSAWDSFCLGQREWDPLPAMQYSNRDHSKQPRAGLCHHNMRPQNTHSLQDYFQYSRRNLQNLSEHTMPCFHLQQT